MPLQMARLESGSHGGLSLAVDTRVDHRHGKRDGVEADAD